MREIRLGESSWTEGVITELVLATNQYDKISDRGTAKTGLREIAEKNKQQTQQTTTTIV